MNQTFNLSRFSRYFVKHTIDNHKLYLMSLLVLLGILLLLLGFIKYVNGGALPIETQEVFCCIALVFSGSIFSSMIFIDLGDKKKAISMLTLPVSAFENFLVGWIFSFLIFQVLYFSVFYLVVAFVQSMSEGTFGKDAILNLFVNEIGIAILVYALLNAIALLGSVYFKRYHFIKTACIILVLVFLTIFLNEKFMEIFVSPYVGAAIPFAILVLYNPTLELHVPLQDYLPYFIGLISVAILLWVSSYLKLKEKQV